MLDRQDYVTSLSCHSKNSLRRFAHTSILNRSSAAFRVPVLPVSPEALDVTYELAECLINTVV